jgi:hypothetical protein
MKIGKRLARLLGKSLQVRTYDRSINITYTEDLVCGEMTDNLALSDIGTGVYILNTRVTWQFGPQNYHPLAFD